MNQSLAHKIVSIAFHDGGYEEDSDHSFTAKFLTCWSRLAVWERYLWAIVVPSLLAVVSAFIVWIVLDQAIHVPWAWASVLAAIVMGVVAFWFGGVGLVCGFHLVMDKRAEKDWSHPFERRTPPSYDFHDCPYAPATLKCEGYKCDCDEPAINLQLGHGEWEWRFRCDKCSTRFRQNESVFYYIPLYNIKVISDVFFWMSHVGGSVKDKQLYGWLGAINKLFPGAVYPSDTERGLRPCEAHLKSHEIKEDKGACLICGEEESRQRHALGP